MPKIAKIFNKDSSSEKHMADFMKTGSLWVTLKNSSYDRCIENEMFSEDYATTWTWYIRERHGNKNDHIPSGSIVMILEYKAKFHDHLIKFLCGKNIYKACIARGYLGQLFALVSESSQNYNIK